MPVVEKVSSIMSTGSYSDGLVHKHFNFVGAGSDLNSEAGFPCCVNWGISHPKNQG